MIYIALQREDISNNHPANLTKTWNMLFANNIDHPIGTSVPLVDENGVSTDRAVEKIVSDNGGWTSSGFNDGENFGAAAWVDEAVLSQYRWFVSGSGPAQIKHTGCVPNDTYYVETFGNQNASVDRETYVSVNGSTPALVPTFENYSETQITETTADANGEILIEYTSGNGDNSYFDVIRIYHASEAPTVVVATNSPQGGEVFQFSGSNYSAQPTGPMTFTQGTRTISRAVTISNWDAEDGSFTGVTDAALPGVPAAGASDTPALLYGEPVTISLPDPGA